uniref:Gustatory receptor n=1 Tax=Anopheles atroparvus TaxID=41427 RepID=A0A182JJ71_ANOAO
MGLLREQRVLLVVLEWCALLHYTPPTYSARQRTLAYRLYCLRAATSVVCLLTMTSIRVQEILQAVHIGSVSYTVWLTAVIVETLVVVVVLLANVMSVSHFEALNGLIERLEFSIETRSPMGCVYPPYGLAIGSLMLLCVMYHVVLMFCGYTHSISMLLQLQVEVVIADLYTIQLVFLLLAVGRCARRLGRMLHEGIVSNCVADVCAVLRLRDDLVHAVVLINRYYGVFFLGCCTSWAVSITSLLYFDFVIGAVSLLDSRSLWLHSCVCVWKSAVIGGLLMVAGSVTARVKQVTQAAERCESHPSNNGPLAKMIDKALVKCQFQDIRFTVYGLFTIDNSLSYSVICSIVTYLVILVQFRQFEEQN